MTNWKTRSVSGSAYDGEKNMRVRVDVEISPEVPIELDAIIKENARQQAKYTLDRLYVHREWRVGSAKERG